MTQWQRVFGGFSGAIGVATGAYSAHGLKGKNEGYVRTFETGSRYQVLHSILLIATPAICGPSTVAARVSGAFFSAGIAMFSGSCYAVGITEDRSNGKLAPIGGISLMCGWISLALMRK